MEDRLWELMETSAQNRSLAADEIEAIVAFLMSDMFDDDSGDSSGGGSARSGKHCDACNEWLDSSDTHCPNCGSAR